jgi:hypothetical protein
MLSCSTTPIIGSYYDDGYSASALGLTCTHCHIHPLVIIIMSLISITSGVFLARRYTAVRDVALHYIDGAKQSCNLVYTVETQLHDALSRVARYDSALHKMRSACQTMAVEHEAAIAAQGGSSSAETQSVVALLREQLAHAREDLARVQAKSEQREQDRAAQVDELQTRTEAAVGLRREAEAAQAKAESLCSSLQAQLEDARVQMATMAAADASGKATAAEARAVAAEARADAAEARATAAEAKAEDRSRQVSSLEQQLAAAQGEGARGRLDVEEHTRTLQAALDAARTEATASADAALRDKAGLEAALLAARVAAESSVSTAEAARVSAVTRAEEASRALGKTYRSLRKVATQLDVPDDDDDDEDHPAQPHTLATRAAALERRAATAIAASAAALSASQRDLEALHAAQAAAQRSSSETAQSHEALVAAKLQAEAQVGALQSQASALEARVSQLTGSCEELEQAHDELAQAHAELEHEYHRAADALEHAQAREERAAEQMKELSTEIKSSGDAVRAAETDAERARHQADLAKQTADAASAQLEQLRRDKAVVEAEAVELRSQLDQVRTQAIESRSELKHAEAMLARTQTDAAELRARLETAEADRETLRGRITALSEGQATHSQLRERELAELRHASEQADQAARAAKHAEAEAEARLRKLEAQHELVLQTQQKYVADMSSLDARLAQEKLVSAELRKENSHLLGNARAMLELNESVSRRNVDAEKQVVLLKRERVREDMRKLLLSQSQVGLGDASMTMNHSTAAPEAAPELDHTLPEFEADMGNVSMIQQHDVSALSPPARAYQPRARAFVASSSTSSASTSTTASAVAAMQAATSASSQRLSQALMTPSAPRRPAAIPTATPGMPGHAHGAAPHSPIFSPAPGPGRAQGQGQGQGGFSVARAAALQSRAKEALEGVDMSISYHAQHQHQQQQQQQHGYSVHAQDLSILQTPKFSGPFMGRQSASASSIPAPSSIASRPSASHQHLQAMLNTPSQPSHTPTANDAPGSIGIRVDRGPLSPSSQLHATNLYQIPADVTGCLITSVAPQTFASHAGLLANDVILSINNVRTQDHAAFVAAKGTLKANSLAAFVVRRGKFINTIPVHIGRKGEATKLSASQQSRMRVRLATNTEADAEMQL